MGGQINSGNAKYFSSEEFSRIERLSKIGEGMAVRALIVVNFKRRTKGLNQYVVVTPEFVINNRRAAHATGAYGLPANAKGLRRMSSLRLPELPDKMRLYQ